MKRYLSGFLLALLLITYLSVPNVMARGGGGVGGTYSSGSVKSSSSTPKTSTSTSTKSTSTTTPKPSTSTTTPKSSSTATNTTVHNNTVIIYDHDDDDDYMNGTYGPPAPTEPMTEDEFVAFMIIIGIVVGICILVGLWLEYEWGIKLADLWRRIWRKK